MSADSYENGLLVTRACMYLIARIDFETHDSRPRAEFNVTAAMNVHREYHGPTLENRRDLGSADPQRLRCAACRAPANRAENRATVRSRG